MSIHTAMIEENLDQREGQPEPNSAGGTGGGAVLGATPCSALEWEKIALWLYAILDDIDTASDHAKGDDVKYRECVERLQRLRGEVGASFDGQILTWRNPPEEYGLTRLWHPCASTPWPNTDYATTSQHITQNLTSESK